MSQTNKTGKTGKANQGGKAGGVGVSVGPVHRQVVFWRLLGAAFGQADRNAPFEKLATELLKQVPELKLPESVLDPMIGIETLIQRHPHLGAYFDAPLPGAGAAGEGAEETEAGAKAEGAKKEEAPESAELEEIGRLRRGLVYSKLLLNTLGPCTRQNQITAQQYQQWTQDVSRLERCFGYAPGQLRGKGGTSGGGGQRLLSEEDLRGGFQQIEGDLIHRMALREVLKDDRLAAQLTPSMALLEQLLHDKGNLSGNALRNAKPLIQALCRRGRRGPQGCRSMKAVKGRLDRSVPPKRVLPQSRSQAHHLEEPDQLQPRRTAGSTSIKLYYQRQRSEDHADAADRGRRSVGVDGRRDGPVHHPGVDLRRPAACRCPPARLRHAGDRPDAVGPRPLRGADAHQPGRRHLDLQGPELPPQKIEEPRNTTVVLISDFFEGGSDQVLLDTIKAIMKTFRRSLHPGRGRDELAATTRVSEFFRTRLKELGTPILSGSVKKLISELKAILLT